VPLPVRVRVSVPTVPFVVNIVLATFAVASYSRLPSIVTSFAVMLAVVDAVVV
jgi:hypothetical protein